VPRFLVRALRMRATPTASSKEAPGFEDFSMNRAAGRSGLLSATAAMGAGADTSLAVMRGGTSGAEARHLLLEHLFAASGKTRREAESATLIDPSAPPSEERHFDADGLVASIGSLDAVLVSVVSRGGGEHEVSALLHRGASARTALLDSGPVLSLSARHCSAGVSKLLMDAGAEVDEKDSRGWTPLMHAVDAHTPTHSYAAPSPYS